MDIGGAIKRIRKAKGLSQIDLANKSGVSQTSLSQIEKGRKRASENTIDKVAKAMGTLPIYITLEAIERSDIPPHKLEVYDMLLPAFEGLKALVKEN